MRVADIVNQLAAKLPALESEFTDNVTLASLTRSSTVMTAKCLSKHGAAVGDSVLLTGAFTPIDVTSLDRSGVIGTLVTAADHDLTLVVHTSITLSGTDEAIFNDDFTILTIPNRRTVTFTMADSGATSATGGILENGESYLNSYDGLYAVASIPSDTDFTFIHSDTGLADPVGTIEVRAKPRVAAAITPQRAAEIYSKQPAGKYWLFVVLDDVAVSKDRRNDSDAIANRQRGVHFQQSLVEGFSVYLFMPVSDELAAEDARDVAGDLTRSVCRSLAFAKFDTQLFAGEDNPVQFGGHAIANYNGSVYVHVYNFQQTADLYFEDTVGADLDVAFRDIAITLSPVFGDLDEVGTSLDLDIDLDTTDL